MSRETDIKRLRRLINEPSDSSYTDDELGKYLDDFNNKVYGVAAEIWMEKASQLAPDGMTSYSVGSESYSFNKEKAYEHAMSMYRFYKSKSNGPTIIGSAKTDVGAVGESDSRRGLKDYSRLSQDHAGW